MPYNVLVPSNTKASYQTDQNIVAQWYHMATNTWINIGTGKGMLPDGTKPLLEPMLFICSCVIKLNAISPEML